MHKHIRRNGNAMLWCLGVCIGIIGGMTSTIEAGKITLITPKSGTVGTIITVEGEGYAPSETIRIDLAGQFGAVKTRCSEEGTFSTSFQLGKHPGGVNKFVVVGFTSYALDSGTISVESRISLITPTSGKVGEFMTITGDGYFPGEEISVSFGENKEIKTILADAEGGFTILFTTDYQSAGRKRIIVSGVNSKQTNSTEYILQGSIQSVIPTYGPVGSLLTVEGAGFGKEELVRVDFGKTKDIICTTSTSNGRFSFIFTVDTQSQGKKDIVVTGTLTGEKDKRGFVITPYIELVTPTMGSVGTILTIVATGFGDLEPIRIDLGRTLAAGRTESDENGVVRTQIEVGPQPGNVKRRLAVIGLRTRQISFTDVFTTLPTIKIIPPSGEVGSNVCIHGEGFPAEEAIRIDFANVTTIAVATADHRAGNFDAWFTLPPHPIGKANITVSALGSGEVITGEFIVKPKIKLISPSTTASVEDVIEIQGEGFGPSEVIKINLGKTENIGQGITDLDGNFTVLFTITPQPSGQKTCTVIGITSGEKRDTIFTIKGKISISPTSGVFGTIVTVIGSGYEVSEPIRVDFGKSSNIAKATADNNGSFITNFTVDTKTKEEVRVRTIGLHSWTVNTVNFMVVEEEKKEKEEVKPKEGVTEGESKEEESQEGEKKE